MKSPQPQTEREPTWLLDRRSFLGSVGLATGAVMASALLPASLQTAEASIGTQPDEDGLWSVDVMCGHWPPYSHPIPYGRPQSVELFANVAPADLMFVV